MAAPFLNNYSTGNPVRSVTQPVGLEGQQVILPNNSVYTMQGASYAGTPVVQYRTPYQSREVSYMTPEQMNAARNYNAGVVASGYSPSVNVRNFTGGYMDNFNPELQGGVSNVEVNGQMVRVPNFYLQQLMFEDRANQGRSSAVGDFFGGRAANPNPEVYRYSDIGASVGNINRYIDNNPYQMSQGAIDPYARARQANIDAYQRLQTAQQNMNNYTETRNPAGAIIGEDAMGARRKAVNDAQSEFDRTSQEFRNMDNRQNRRSGEAYAQGAVNQAQREIGQGIQPTYSNVPIRETLIY